MRNPTFGGLLVLIVLLATLLASCLSVGFPFRREFVERKSVSNFTVDGNDIYFGAGPNLHRLNGSTKSVETLYTTNNARVEQPILADGMVYFGVLNGYSKNGTRGEPAGFYAFNPLTEEKLWKFPLNKGYGTFGTFPAISGDRILVCAREHLYALDRKTGNELWKIDNWMGSTGGTVNIPYIFDNHVYFMVEEELIAGTKKTDENDGHWAEVPIENGERSIFPIAERPGTYEDSDGTGVGTLVDGVIYGNSRVGRFGALDLRSKKLLWEVATDTLIKPVVLDGKVYLVRNEEIQAIDQRTGKTIWTKPLRGISNALTGGSDYYEENHARRMTSNDELLIVQGSAGIGAFNLKNGLEQWRLNLPSTSTSSRPVIVGDKAFVLSESDCSILELALKTGTENARIAIPSCSYYQLLDD